MNISIQIFALLAGLLHVLIFFMESLWFMRPNVHSRFGVNNTADADTVRIFAFNQGFYNLFLAIGVFIGLGLIHLSNNLITAQTLVLFSCSCMLAAAVVLAYSANKKMLRAAFIQGIFPMLALISWLFF